MSEKHVADGTIHCETVVRANPGNRETFFPVQTVELHPHTIPHQFLRLEWIAPFCISISN